MVLNSSEVTISSCIRVIAGAMNVRNGRDDCLWHHGRDGRDASYSSGYRIRHCSRTTLLRDVLPLAQITLRVGNASRKGRVIQRGCWLKYLMKYCHDQITNAVVLSVFPPGALSGERGRGVTLFHE